MNAVTESAPQDESSPLLRSARDYTRFVSRRETVSGKDLIVLDGLFSETYVATIYDYLRSRPYKLNDIDSAETDYARHWKHEFPLESGPPPRATIVGMIHSFFGPTQVLKRSHSNLTLYGDVQFPHRDSKDGITAVYFANATWKPEWMGETTFHDDAGEPLYAVAPRPGRVVLFQGSIMHRAGVATRECFEPRITLAFKFLPIE
jgi:SM-20-related protein